MQSNPWMQRAKWLTQALIISGTINIGLIATFIYFVVKERQETLAIELKPAISTEARQTIAQLLRSYTLLPFQEHILRLENSDLIEDGLTKRDLSLACLVAFHHFNLDKALGGLPLQKRVISYANADGQETIDVPVFPGLADFQFQAIMQYAKTEKWPLTAQGLFYEIKRSYPCDTSLLEAFYLTPEYHFVSTLFSKTGAPLSREQIVELISQGEWTTLNDFAKQQRQALDLTPDRRRTFLAAYLNDHSFLAARLLLDTDHEYALKRLDDEQVLKLLALYTEKTPSLESYAKELLASPRTDAVCKRAAAILYQFVNEPVPEPYDHALVMQRFFPVLVQVQSALPAPAKVQKRIHTVETGENLWKIARKYHVSIDEIMRVNHLETEKLRPGKQLEIP